MDTVEYIIKYVSMFSLFDAVDIIIVAYLTYKLIKLISRTNTGQVVKGIILLLIIMPLSRYLRLNVVNFILVNTMQLGFLAIIIVFQPELRKALEKVGSSRLPQILEREDSENHLEQAIMQTVEACRSMSWSRDGALIVFEREIRLSEIVKTGTLINAVISSEIIKNIFYPKAPLHDGAVIIQRARITAAGCMLPLSNNANLSRELGMRHRAGVGMSENSDAVVVVVSEETGSISVAIGGMLKRHLAPETLEKLLRNELLPKNDENKKSGLFGFMRVKKS